MIGILLLIPLITAVLCYFSNNRRVIEYINLTGAAIIAVASIFPISASLSTPIFFFRGMFFMDALSAYILSIVMFVSVAAAIYSVDYMGSEFKEGLIGIKEIRYFYALLYLFIFTMVLAVVSNNIAIFWMAIESTTIVSSLLVGFYKDRASVESRLEIYYPLYGKPCFRTAWHIYHILCICFCPGWRGHAELDGTQEITHDMNPKTIKLAFLFILVGYGPKPGLRQYITGCLTLTARRLHP